MLIIVNCARSLSKAAVRSKGAEFLIKGCPQKACTFLLQTVKLSSFQTLTSVLNVMKNFYMYIYSYKVLRHSEMTDYPLNTGLYWELLLVVSSNSKLI